MEDQSIYRNLDYVDLGLIDYDIAWRIQKSLFQKRLSNLIPDTLLLLEHPNTYTLGKTADRNNLIGNESYLESKNIKVYVIDRGGDITYHGPGQIVGYLILDLNRWKKDAHLYLRALEEVIINTCGHYGLTTERNDEHTGVWIEDRKNTKGVRKAVNSWYRKRAHEALSRYIERCYAVAARHDVPSLN